MKKNITGSMKMNLQHFAEYNGIISRDDAQALIPEEVSREIIEGAVQNSAVMQLATRAPNMSRNHAVCRYLAACLWLILLTGKRRTEV